MGFDRFPAGIGSDPPRGREPWMVPGLNCLLTFRWKHALGEKEIPGQEDGTSAFSAVPNIAYPRGSER